ncbi:zona pellucida domain-containing protein miniature isoform X3 [Rhodnius prolixus]|uniref:zona pellucida domain-containing protein miniature isoform X3 n=1 Tax=Rhodnius prolixus TaxID=13249 RepID=UPI003D18EBB2
MELRDGTLVFIAGFIIYLVKSTLGGDIWPLERPEGMPAIQSLEVMCGKDHMDVHLSFTQPFEGIVSSKGQYADPRCVYVPPSTGKTFFSFRIAYARCGTKPDLNGQFYENTVVVQYDKDLLEVWDEAKRLRCEWYNDYEKTASKPPMVIADLDVIQLDFRGDNVDCWMEIQHGKGPWAPPVSGIVPLGSTLTLVVAINDNRGEFDMRVKSCAASDGGGHVIQLSDEYGCVLRPKMISRFLKARIVDERASVITYAFFHAFKFPDALSVHIKCKVEICRHGCLDHCQLAGSAAGVGYGPLERRDPPSSSPVSPEPTEPPAPSRPSHHEDDELIYDEMVDLGKDVFGSEHGERLVSTSIGGNNGPQAQAQHHPPTPTQGSSAHQPPPPVREHVDDIPHPFQEAPLRSTGVRENSQERFPHGPRNLETDTLPLVTTLNQRKKRSVVVSDRKTRSADVGVSGLYEVISEADLAFTPDAKGEAVTVFQGRIREEVVYGICLPVPGFSALFVLVAVSAVVSALVAGALLYRYQVQRETQEIVARHQQQARLRARQQTTAQSPTSPEAAAPTSNASWIALRLLRPRQPPPNR